MNYYNTFSIRQEMERAAGVWTQHEDDYWQIPDSVLKSGSIRQGSGCVYQDPYKRATFAATVEELKKVTSQISATMAQGMREASVFIITLGLTEVFVKLDDGLVANQTPRPGRPVVGAKTRFHASSFKENLENLERSIELIRQFNPAAQVVISVSPVALARTFTEDDVFVANLRSKSILLAVAREVCERSPWCHYFPAYEVITTKGRSAFLADGRHVKPAVVSSIVRLFMESTFKRPEDLERNVSAADRPAGRAA